MGGPFLVVHAQKERKKVADHVMRAWMQFDVAATGLHSIRFLP